MKKATLALISALYPSYNVEALFGIPPTIIITISKSRKQQLCTYVEDKRKAYVNVNLIFENSSVIFHNICIHTEQASNTFII